MSSNIFCVPCHDPFFAADKLQSAHLSYVKPKSKKRVRFAPEKDIGFYQPDNTNSSEMFYSNEEYRNMRIARRRAATNGRRRYALLLSKGHFDEAEVLTRSWAGIENFLTPGMIEKMAKGRARCLSAVLDEQARQIDSGEYDPDRLSHTSQRWSIWAVQRAEKIGCHQSR